jgi:hypothetical protein
MNSNPKQRTRIFSLPLNLPLSTIHSPPMDQELPITEVTIPFEELSEETLPSLLKRFSSNARNILKLRYGIGGSYCYTRDEVRKILNITRERVRQIEERVINTLARRTGSTKKHVIDTLTTFAKNNSQASIDPDTVSDIPISDLRLSYRACKCLNRLDSRRVDPKDCR